MHGSQQSSARVEQDVGRDNTQTRKLENSNRALYPPFASAALPLPLPLPQQLVALAVSVFAFFLEVLPAAEVAPAASMALVDLTTDLSPKHFQAFLNGVLKMTVFKVAFIRPWWAPNSTHSSCTGPQDHTITRELLIQEIFSASEMTRERTYFSLYFLCWGHHVHRNIVSSWFAEVDLLCDCVATVLQSAAQEAWPITKLESYLQSKVRQIRWNRRCVGSHSFRSVVCMPY